MLVEQYCQVMKDEEIDCLISPSLFGEKPPKIADIEGAKDKNVIDNSPVFEYK